MFEDYLEDAWYFASEAKGCELNREAKRYYRASVLFSIGALEAFINFIGDVMEKGEVFAPYEIAFLTDKKFGPDKGDFKVFKQSEFHRLEEKLEFLLLKFVPNFNFALEPSWSRLIMFKRFRDKITHPRNDEDEIEVTEYEKSILLGLSAVVDVMNSLSKGIFRKPLRQKIQDLGLGIGF